MKHLNRIAFVVIVFFNTVAYAQNLEDPSEEQLFLNWFFQNYQPNFKNDPLILYTDAIHTGSLKSIKESFSRDTLRSLRNGLKELLVLTTSEKLYINNQLDKMTGRIWHENLLKNSQMISLDSIQTFFEKQGPGWTGYYKKYTTGFYSFSKPIFLRNNTICIFDYSYYCGSLCANGETGVYFKHNGKWSKWLTISTWIS